MSERKIKENEHKQEEEVKETKLSENESLQSTLTDPKLEKKVTFARLLNKVGII